MAASGAATVAVSAVAAVASVVYATMEVTRSADQQKRYAKMMSDLDTEFDALCESSNG